MKSFLASLTTVFLAAATFLGVGATVGAQGSRQQPEEIPPQYSAQRAQYPPEPGRYPQEQGQSQQAPNDSAAGRVSYIHGDLSTQHSDSGEWVAATINTPIVYGDRISTGKRSRAEIQLDHANVLRMADESTANVVNLSRTQIQLQIAQGLVNYDVLRNSEANVEIETPNVAIRPQMNGGSYRITVNSDGETIVDVREGSAEISTPHGSTRVDRDQRITIQGNADNAQYNISAAYRRDDWDKWNDDRDHVIERATSWRHTDPYYTGTHDLDDYGHWRDVPDYGSVWFPESGPDWAPYREGRWVFEPYYGWTWVSYEPWGWAPYHYGRWFVYGGNWGWWPGPVYGGYRPIWAPAYVSFFGFGGGGWSVGVGVGFGGGFGNIGWLPCGPGDRFYPWYGRGGDRVNVVNITNITNVNNIHNNYGGYAPLREGRGYSNVERAFSDPHVRSGISSMGAHDFGRGSVPAHQQRVDPGSLRQASVITSGHPATPSRESFRPSDRQVNPAAIPSRASTNQRFFSDSRTGRSVQGQPAQGGVNRGGNPAVNQPQQNAGRPGVGNFGSNNSGNVNSGNRQGPANSGSNLPQQNADRSGPRSFGPNGAGNINHSQVPQQAERPSSGNTQGSRGFAPPSSQQSPSNSTSSARPGWRPFTPPARSIQPDNGARNSAGNPANGPQQNPQRPGYRSFDSGGGNSGNTQGSRGFGSSPSQSQAPSNRSDSRPFTPPPSHSAQSDSGGRNFGAPYSGPSRPNYSQPSEPPRQYQNNSRGNSGGPGYSRPPLNMQQPVVTPRGGGSYSAPPPRSAPSGGGYSNAPGGGGYRGPQGGGYGGGGSRGAPSGGGNGGGGGSRGGTQSGGGSPQSGGHNSGRNNH
jgi:hypothetical protein